MAKSHVKVGFVSLGCSKNLCDTEIMLRHLVDEGYEITPEESEADIVIVNTCAFIESAKKESIDSILDLGWLKKNHTLRGIIVTGCLAERYREQVTAELPEVDAILGVGGIHRIGEAVKSVVDSWDKKTGKAKKTKFACFDDKESSELGGERVITTGDAMAYL